MVQHHGLWFWLCRIWQLLQVVGCITVMSIIYIFVLVFCFGMLLKLDISGFLFCELLRLLHIMQTSLKFCLSYLSTNCLSFYCSQIILYPYVFHYINLFSPKSEFLWLCYKVKHPQWQQYMAQYFTFFCVEYPFGPLGIGE
jgi:hypothetical protein